MTLIGPGTYAAARVDMGACFRRGIDRRDERSLLGVEQEMRGSERDEESFLSPLRFR